METSNRMSLKMMAEGREKYRDRFKMPSVDEATKKEIEKRLKYHINATTGAGEYGHCKIDSSKENTLDRYPPIPA